MAFDENSDWVRMGVAAALSKSREGDLPGYLEQVTCFLEQLMPQSVKRKTVGLFKKSLCGIEVFFPEERLGLDFSMGNLTGWYTKVSRGIALKTESVTLPEWIELLTTALEDRANQDASAREGLRNLLGLN